MSDYTLLSNVQLQLDLIVDVVGSPTADDLSSACETARQHVLRRARHQPDLTILYGLSNDCDHEVVHLLCQMLVFNPVSYTCHARVYFSVSFYGRLAPVAFVMTGKLVVQWFRASD